jgi:nucleoside-diphosphate-sugar epimerase
VRRKPDISKAKEILFWQPDTKVEDGLKQTIDYFRSLAG